MVAFTQLRMLVCSLLIRRVVAIRIDADGALDV